MTLCASRLITYELWYTVCIVHSGREGVRTCIDSTNDQKYPTSMPLIVAVRELIAVWSVLDESARTAAVTCALRDSAARDEIIGCGAQGFDDANPEASTTDTLVPPKPTTPGA